MKQLTTDVLLVTTLFLTLLFSSCNNDDDTGMDLPTPIIENVEIGLGNNGIGIIGRDFHLDMDVIAGNLIHSVQVQIQQQTERTYSREWSFEIIWDEYKGIKNTNVHKHFDIPEDAVEGIYDFMITVIDENGSVFEETYDFEIMDPSNLPVDPLLYIWMITTDQGDFHYVNETLVNPENVEFSEGEILQSDATIQNVNGDGKMYLLLIKKSLNHLPETVEDIDFSKVVVYDVFDHENEDDVFSFGNIIFDGEGGQERSSPEFTIGALTDNNVPQPDPINGEKEWETGKYYFGVVYTNFTHNLSVHHYFEVDVVMD